MSGFIYPAPPRANFTGTAAPSASNDSTQGYTVGSEWDDITNDRLYKCIDAAPAAAIWLPVGYQPEYAAGDYLRPLGVANVTSGTPATAAAAFGWPFFAPTQMTFDRVGVGLVTAQAGAACRIGAYRKRGGPLLADFGELDLSAGSGTDVEATISFPVTGPFWLVVWLKNVATQATFLRPGASTTNHVGQLGLTAGPTGSPLLRLADTYPGSMPSTMPAVVPTAVLNAALPQLRVA